MDDFRIIFYVILGIIFVVSRIVKANKSTNQPPKRPGVNRPQQGSRQGKPAPASFEDILKEFGEKVEEKSLSREKSVVRQQESRPKPRAYEQKFEEGRDRMFADEESRRVYEESIKRSEGFDIKFGEDINFGSKRTKFGEGAIRKDIHQKNPLIRSIKKDLKDKDGIRKAFILSEILNRRY